MLGLSKRIQMVSGGNSPLDAYYNNAVLGFSYYKLFKSYRGYCLRVRRSSDNAEMDFGFVNGYIDVAGIVAFCGNGNGYVSVWYNQYSLGNNAIQADTTKQPRIVNNGVFDSEGLLFDNDNLTTLSIDRYSAIRITNYPLAIYANYTSDINQAGFIFSKVNDYELMEYYDGGTPNLLTFRGSGGADIIATNNIPQTGLRKTLSQWIDSNVDGVEQNFNGTNKKGTMATTVSDNSNIAYIGGLNATYCFTGKIKTIVIFNAAVDYNIVSKV